MDDLNWEKADGNPCCRCGERDFRIQNGLCRSCHAQEQKRLGKRLELKARVRALSPVFRSRRLAAGKR